MQMVTCRVITIDNGFIVETYPDANTTTGVSGTSHNQYCADLNTVASYLVGVFVPGATYTPPAASGS